MYVSRRLIGGRRSPRPRRTRSVGFNNLLRLVELWLLKTLITEPGRKSAQFLLLGVRSCHGAVAGCLANPTSADHDDKRLRFIVVTLCADDIYRVGQIDRKLLLSVDYNQFNNPSKWRQEEETKLRRSDRISCRETQWYDIFTPPQFWDYTPTVSAPRPNYAHNFEILHGIWSFDYQENL